MPYKVFFWNTMPCLWYDTVLFITAEVRYQGSLSYNPMTCLVIIAVLLGFHKKLFNHKKIIDGILIIAAIVTLAFYIYRVFSLNVDV